ncbi:hypothetical protein [Trichothermofontia sp.]
MFDTTTADSSATFFQNLDPTTQSALSPDSIQVPEAVLQAVQTRLASFFSEPDFLNDLRMPFGDDFDVERAKAIAQDFRLFRV